MIAKRTSASHAATPIEGDSQRWRRRRELGIVYTPPPLVESILDEVLEPILAQMTDAASCRARLRTLRIIDPACGCGYFLLGAWRRLARKIAQAVAPASRPEFLREAAGCLYGIDIDPGAAVAGMELLQAECGDGELTPRDFRHWATVGDALLDGGGDERTFDAVIGNPPFVDSESMCMADPARRRELAGRYATARGNWDLASLFVERAIRLARPGGRIGLVLPRRLLASDHAQHVQELIKRQTIESIRVNAADAFEDAAVETISMVFRCAAANTGHAIRIIEGAQSRVFAQSGVDSLPPGHWSAMLCGSQRCGSMAGRLHTLAHLPSLSQCAFIGDGATTGEAYRLRDVIVERDLAAGASVRLINTGTIDPFAQRWGKRPTRYLKTAWLQPVIPLDWLDANLPRRAAQARSPKVLVAGLAGRIEAVVDHGVSLCGKSAVQVIPGDDIDLHALCAWLNSGPINDLYRGLFESHGFGRRSMHIGPRQLERLPAWRVGDARCAGAVAELARLSQQAHAAADSQAHQQRIDAIVDALLR